MTPREMTAEEAERVLGYLANGRQNSADLPFEVSRVRAHIAALRARAEAAEADNAALSEVLQSIEHVDSRNPNEGMRYCPACGECEAGHSDDCALGHALHGAFRPGAGYRAKVRAELLRAQAAHHRERAALEWHLERKWHEAEAMRLEAQAAREEQG